MTGSRERILCFGGSFNPIHNGHLLCAQAVAECAGFDQVLLIPSSVPPLRRDQKDMASAVHRLTMCQLAVASAPRFAVSDIELTRTGPSYTVDTASALKAEGHKQIHWLIGIDTVNQLPMWHDIPRLLQAVHFVVMRRPGWEFAWDEADQSLQQLRRNVVEAPLIEISASEIRRRVSSGRKIHFHTPPAVAAYISDNGLYR